MKYIFKKTIEFVCFPVSNVDKVLHTTLANPSICTTLDLFEFNLSNYFLYEYLSIFVGVLVNLNVNFGFKF